MTPWNAITAAVFLFLVQLSYSEESFHAQSSRNFKAQKECELVELSQNSQIELPDYCFAISEKNIQNFDPNAWSDLQWLYSKRAPNLGFTSKTVFFKFKLINKSKSGRNYYLKVGTNFTKKIRLFKARKPEIVTIQNVFFHERKIKKVSKKNKNLFDLGKVIDEEHFLLAINSKTSNFLPIEIFNLDGLLDSRFDLFKLIFYGIMIFLIMASLLFYLFEKEKIAISYFGFLVCSTGYQLFKDGYLNEVIENTALLNESIVSTILIGACLVMLDRYFKAGLSGLPSRFLNEKIRIGLLIFVILIAITLLFTPFQQYSFISLSLFFLMYNAVFLYVAINKYKSGLKNAKFVACGVGLFLFCNILYALQVFGILNLGNYYFYGTKLSNMSEAFFFSYNIFNLQN